MTVFNDWAFDCDQGFCQVFSTSVDPTQQDVLISVSVVDDRNSNQSSMIVNVNALVALVPGLRLWLSPEVERVIPYQFCEPSGCKAIIELGPDLLEALRATDRAFVEYLEHGNPAKATHPISLDGFDEAFGNLQDNAK